jgi:serine/threonine protein phosphatase PrpC
MKFSIVQDSRKGARRYNQDRVGHWRAPQALAMVLADGMGGYEGAELAAAAAVEHVGEVFRAQATPQLSDAESFLSRTMQGAHAAVVRAGSAAGLGAKPRTTLVSCVVQGGYAYWSYIGDSRLYLIREGRIVARTRDHTQVQQLVDSGRMREEAVASHPERGKLLRALGGTATPAPEPAASARLARGDIVLLCSDGLWGPLTPRLILTAFIGKDPARALPELMTLAEARAGSECDNVSAIAMQWHDEAVLDLFCAA